MAYYRQDIVTHFNNNEPEVTPWGGYPERSLEWFEKNILPDFLNCIDEYHIVHGDLLDVGCSYGYFTKEYAKYFSGVTGIDFSSIRIDGAKMVNVFDNIDYQLINLVSDTIDTSFIANGDKFDVAISTAVYQHIDPQNDRKQAFQTTADALKDGSYLFLYDEDFVSRPEKWNGFYSPLSEEWVRTELADMFELLSKELVCRGDHGEHIYRWVLKKG